MDNTTETDLQKLMDNTTNTDIIFKAVVPLGIALLILLLPFIVYWMGVCWCFRPAGYSRRIRNEKLPEWCPCHYRPEAPDNLKVDEITNSSVTLTWNWSGHENMDSGYYVEKCEVDTETWFKENENPTHSKLMKVNELTKGKKYLFRVTAQDDIGKQSMPSEPTKEIIAKFNFDSPSSPKELAVKERAANKISLTWKAPDSNGGDAILGYYIEKKEGSALGWNKIYESPIPNLAYTASDLKENTSYEFRVLAENQDGEGMPSKSVKTKTKQLSHGPPKPVSEILSSLKREYNKYLRIKPFPFLEDYINLEDHFCSLHLVTRETRNQLRQSKTGILVPELLSRLIESTPVELCDIFKADKDGGVPPKHILIEGEPGIGKTSLCVKLANDWSQGKSFTAEKFQGVFFITARNVNTNVNIGIQDYLCEFLNMSQNDAEQVWNCMQDAQYKNSFLFIIDGLDEVVDTLPAEECRYLFSKSCVLATSRTNQWQSKLPSSDPNFQLFDREIVNVGFTQETAFEFIGTVGTVKRAESPIETLQEFIGQHEFLEDLIRSPLICIFLCIMWNENYIIPFVEENEFRRTVLYAKMIECLVKRYCRQPTVEKTYKLVDGDDGKELYISSATKEKLGQIYKVAYCAFQDGEKVQVSIGDVRQYLDRDSDMLDENDVMFSFGILVKEKYFEKTVFAFPHRTVQEELSSEFYFDMTSEGERVAASKQIVNSFPLMCIFISGLVFYRDSLDPALLVPLFKEMANKLRLNCIIN